MKLFLTGASGMLAGAVRTQAEAKGLTLLCSDHRASEGIKALDITDEAAVRSALSAEKPDWIINCAAYTAVDQAESEPEQASLVNAKGPELLAQTAKEVGARLLHVSTDYVFGGDQEPNCMRAPIAEDEACVPCGVYGESKLKGEQAVQEVLPDTSLIVRTSWLHGMGGGNFVATMLGLADERDELCVVDDQRGSPTWTTWLAGQMLALAQWDARGVFHASSKGELTWYEFAQAIMRFAGKSTVVHPQTTAELGRPARRPYFSVLDTSKLEAALDTTIISWEENLKGHLRELGVLT